MNSSSCRTFLYYIICLLSQFLIVQETEAHTDSLKIWRFVYEVSDVNYKNRGYNDLMNLDVKSDGSSLFYSVYNSKNNNIQASGSDVGSIISAMDSKKEGAHYRIGRDAAKGEITCLTDAPDNFYYKEADLTFQWHISAKDTMTVCGYVCKKATVLFAGRTWIAWFTEDLPVSCGPWKLSGLPGLILSAHDSDNYFNFSCVGIEQTMSLSWNLNSRNHITCTNDEYQKQLRLYAADPVNYALRKLGLPTVSAADVSITDDRGKRGNKLPEFKTVFMEKMPEDNE